jgi:Tol biopolymer transport system component
LYLLRTDQLEPHVIPGTEGAAQPLFSPDGQWIGYEGPNRKFYKVHLDGTAPIAIADAGSSNGADWTVNDDIVLGSEQEHHGLSKFNASGGDLTDFATPDKTKGETDYLWPIAFPDGKRVVFTIWSGSLVTATLATVGIDGGSVAQLGIKGIRPVAVVDGILVYVAADGSVLGVKLNRAGTAVAGKPAPVHDPVFVVPGNNGNSELFVSKGGALLTSRGGASSQLAWVDHDGKRVPITPEVRDYNSPSISPDGRRIAVVVTDQGHQDLWIYDLDTKTFSRLPAADAPSSPVWTPDGSRVVYVGLGGKSRFAIWSQAADGGSPPQKITDALALTLAVNISPDGKSLVYVAFNNNSWDLFRAPLDSSSKASVPYLTSPANEISPFFSPDSKWLAYVSAESGRGEVYVRSFPDPSSRLQVSAGGGNEPVWSRDGSRIFYRQGSVLMSAHLATTPTLRVLSRDTVIADASSLQRTNAVNSGYRVANDGRILGLVTDKDNYQLIVVPNWSAELKRRLAGTR